MPERPDPASNVQLVSASETISINVACAVPAMPNNDNENPRNADLSFMLAVPFPRFV